MKYKILFEEQASSEILNAYFYYEDHQQGLGERFKKVLSDRISDLESNPYIYQRIKKELRQAPVHKFPYVIVYEVMGQTVIVYTVFHTSRNPKNKHRKQENKK